MRLSMLGIVNRTADARAALLFQLQLLENVDNQSLHLTLDGNRMDGTMVALVRPVIAAELRGRIRSLERDLEAQGIVVGN